MKIHYNVTGTQRKALVGAISQELNTSAKYLGAPTFAYEVGGYHIDKNGVMTGPDNLALEADLQGLHDFKAAERDYDEPDTYESGGATLSSTPAFEELQMTEGEELGLGKERREDFHGENGMRADDCPETFTYQAEFSDPDCPERMEVFAAENDVEALKWAKEQCTGEIVLLELKQLDENYDFVRGVDIAELIAANGLYDAFAVEIPKNGLTDAQVQNILKLVESKRTLLTKVLGGPLMINDKGEKLQFLYPYSEEAGVGIIYSQLSTAFVNHAEKHQKVMAAEREVESEKFAMRTFLVRLGMNGGEFRSARKWLCRNLSGNASFPNDASYAAMQVSRRNGAQADEQK